MVYFTLSLDHHAVVFKNQCYFYYGFSNFKIEHPVA